MVARSILVAVIALLPFGLAAGEERIDALQLYEDWAVFIDAGDCWIATTLDFKDDAYDQRVTFFVAFHDRNPDVNLSVLIEADIDLDHPRPLTVGDDSFALLVDDDTAFPRLEEEMPIFRSMLEGAPIAMRLVNEEGQTMRGLVSLEGFHDAYNFLARECKFMRFDGLSDQAGVEPT